MAEEKGLEQNQNEKPMSMMTMVVWTGLFGGVFWSSLAYVAYVFSFTEISPRIILEPWAIGDWKDGWLGTVISIILIGVVSIVAALIYYSALKKFEKMWVGILFGAVLFLLVFFVLNPLFPGMKTFTELERNTIITCACFYILYGTFIGYSISYEYNEFLQRKKTNKEVVY
ncbi:YqhR family membrane protein [Cytobacillus spongiae]|uniref:YqhR family membrane protein n=1 Tax=Cytobacillus spongiae TaxID=2901381 RepID=UPI001F3738E9|nr:YqhR family membrane protein [Cytobacillus spongiae]UII54815.1 YqhR family membrane protein [Cytobacillus spongiae]